MLRIALFLLTNLAIVLVASITLSLLGFEGYLASNGMDLNLSSLLVFCFIFGMAGSVVSLLLSKTMAKMGTGTQIIESPRNADEQWLVFPGGEGPGKGKHVVFEFCCVSNSIGFSYLFCKKTNFTMVES